MYQQESRGEDVQQEAEERRSPSARVIHRSILKEAEEELSRTTSSLFWSGLAAGLSMSFSMITEALLITYLPQARWVPLISNLGYAVGFLLVIFGKQQLFTENTLTPMLPLLHKRNLKMLLNVARLWGVVLIANLLGALLIAFVLAQTSVFAKEVQESFVHIGQVALKPAFDTVLLRGIFAGWLIALMVWLLPYAESAKLWVIVIITYLVGLAHLSHVIVGAVETFTLAAMGQASWQEVLLSYILPALIGNIIGGVVIVAALNHAQVKSGDELD